MNRTLTIDISKKLRKQFNLASLAFCLFVTSLVNAQTLDQYAAVPPTIDTSTTPMVMLVMSRDNQLWHKAYNDYSDLDGDGILDTTYNDNFTYYGYFNSNWCYTYSSSLFSPATAVNSGTHQCSGQWSGNFLNWMTTTRIDVVRRVLYGGKRSTDTISSTVLERALIPNDNHAFVKLVNDAEITGSISDYTPITGHSSLSFCNVTDYVSGSDRTASLDTSVNPPKLKVAIGEWVSWSGTNELQCQFDDENTSSRSLPTQPTRPGISGQPLISGIPTDAELVVRVETCVSGLDASDDEFCREYENSGSPIHKPFGLLQEYGENGDYRIGLMTGSWTRNAEGGVLRKNLVAMGGDGAAPDDLEIDVETGLFINQSDADEGIIHTLDRMRITGWDYGSRRYYDCAAPGIPESTFLTSASADRQCRDWGNPISEIYIEALRYLAGETSATATFAANDSSLIPGLGTVAWEDPYTNDTACSNCSIVVLSTGLNNFDDDQLGSSSDLPSLGAGVEVATDFLGDVEGLSTGSYIVGQGTSGGTIDACDAKNIGVGGLSNVDGLCPEAPSQNGSYNVSGGAYYANVFDYRSVLGGVQNAKTYAVALAETLPSFEIETSSGNSVIFMPTCRSNTNSNALLFNSGWNECSLVDLIVEVEPNALNPYYGRLLISWEDSRWGNDYDMDGYSVIEYCTATGSAAAVRAACPDWATNGWSTYGGSGAYNDTYYGPYRTKPNWNAASSGQIQMRMSVPVASAGYALKFGYVMLGSSADGSYTDEILRRGGGAYDINYLPTESGNMIWSASARIFNSVAATPALLENPLWYAAKYGNFLDSNGNNEPDLQAEWDVESEDGSQTPDGIPDAYFQVKNPATLVTALSKIFADIDTQVGAGSAAAVNAQTGSGEGAIYQALFTPRVEDGIGGAVSWVGTVRAFFIDDQARIREDTDADGVLDEFTDKVIEFTFNSTPGIEETFVQAYDVNLDGSTGAASGPPFALSDIDQFKPLWDAQSTLSSVTNLIANRNYNNVASSGRYIFTAFDRNSPGNAGLDNLITSTSRSSVSYADANTGQSATIDSAHAFEASNFSMTGATANDFRFLGFDNSATQQDVDDLVNYIRGDESIAGFRSRSLGSDKFLLGDFVHSTPAVVSRPQARYDLTYRDESYREFAEFYEERRTMLYVGGNDGMLHAFNGGFYDAANSSYALQLNGEVQHPLGAEVWAYVPFNLLPHLQWLPDPDYPHVYFMDGPVQAFDVNIFTPDADHPNGWGTIIVAGMRFGGGDYSIDHDDDVNTPDRTTRSAYVILDVTNPEVPPKLIAEITDEDLGFSSARPTVVKMRKRDSSGNYSSSSPNAWYLVFGSGPAGNDASERATALEEAVSFKSAKVFTYDLINRQLQKIDTAEANSFIGGFEAADWDLNFDDDAVYYGLVSGDVNSPSGKLKRGKLVFDQGSSVLTSTVGNMTTDLFNDIPFAFSATPTTVRSGQNEWWVFAGTGRFFVGDDNLSTAQQRYYGVKEPYVSGVRTLEAEVNSNDLLDTTRIDVFENGAVREDATDGQFPTLVAAGLTEVLDASTARFETVREFVAQDGVGGWTFQFETPPVTLNPAIRNSTKAALAGESVVITAYEGTGAMCLASGTPFLYTPHLEAGIPAPFAALGVDENYTIAPDDVGEPDPKLVLQGVRGEEGSGSPSDPVVIPKKGDASDPDCKTWLVLSQTSKGELGGTNLNCEGLIQGRQSWREIPVNW